MVADLIALSMAFNAAMRRWSFCSGSRSEGVSHPVYSQFGQASYC